MQIKTPQTSMPQISVIVPIYNAEKYIGYTIDSILQQSFKDFELLLVDDGSTDLSSTIIDNYCKKDSRIRCFHKVNSGVSSTRNYGLDNARGEYVCFLDSDDYMYPDNLEVMIREIKGFELLICNYAQGTRENKEKIKRNADIKERIEAKNVAQISKQICKLDVWYNALCWNKMYLRSFIEANKLRFRSTDFYFQKGTNVPPHDIKLKSIECEDEFFSYEVFNKAKSVKRIDWMGVCYFHNPDSRGSSHRAIPEIDWLSKMDELYTQIYKNFNIDDKRYIYRVNSRFIVRITSYLLKGYYPDTRVNRTERIIRWQQARGLLHRVVYDENIYRLHKKFKFIVWILKNRKEKILDPIILLFIKLVFYFKK